MIEIPTADPYGAQCDAFSAAVREGPTCRSRRRTPSPTWPSSTTSSPPEACSVLRFGPIGPKSKDDGGRRRYRAGRGGAIARGVRRRRHRRRAQRAGLRGLPRRGRAVGRSCSSARRCSAAPPAPERVFPGHDAQLSKYSYLVSLLPQLIVDELGLDVTLQRRQVSSYTPVGDGGDPRRRRRPGGDPPRRSAPTPRRGTSCTR